MNPAAAGTVESRSMILLACPSCDRQYDVTHLEPGSRVRCVCDTLISVKRPKELTVRAKKCSNCGGRIEPDDEACGYCGSKLTELDLTSTLCPACFHRVEDDANHCKACGVEIAPQALTALPEGNVCPRCEGDLAVRSLGTISVVECTACQGLWVKRQDFESICKRAQERPDVLLDGGPAAEPIRSAEPERKVFYIPCPICSTQMMRRQFRFKNLPSRVLIDYCSRHGIWFDKGELETIVSFIRSKGNVDMPFSMDDALGRRPKPRPPSTVPIESVDSSGFGGLLGTLIVADVLGDVVGGLLGGVLGDLFD